MKSQSSLPSSTRKPESAQEREEFERLFILLDEQKKRVKYNAIQQWFPEDGPMRRELYPKHMQFFEAGAVHRERLFMAANRVGKTIAGGYECALHLMGEYPHWWQGRRFDKPVKVLAAGDTRTTTRDIIQDKMLGAFEDMGTGMVPKLRIAESPDRVQGISKAVEGVKIKSNFGGNSQLLLRSYDQGRKIFQGFEADIIWLDEEVPQDIYAEALMRTMTTNGLLIMTFTPLQGLTPLVVDFMETSGLL